MDCKQISILLNAFADRELSKSDQTLVESHIAECADCRAELEDIRRLDATIRCEEIAPDSLRSAIADRLEGARTARPNRSSLKEKLGMKFRIGMAAIGAAALIVVLTMSSGGSAMAAYTKMKKAVTRVTSSHLHLEFGPSALDGVSKDIDRDVDNDSDKDADKDAPSKDGDDMGNLAASALGNLVDGSGPKSLDVWSKDSKWKVSAFGGINVTCVDQWVTVQFGDKVFAKVKADKADLPADMSTFLFNEMTKATDEIKQKCNVRKVATLHEGGKTLDQLEVTGIEDNNKSFRMEYWVDQDTNLPAKFEVYAKGDSGTEGLVCTITCDYNENYPDSMFEVGADKP